MTCEDPEAELVQSLATETLKGEEREAALRHVATCGECRSDLAVLREMAGSLRTLHLTVGEVVEAAWSGMKPEHLADCAVCRDEVATLRRVNQELRGAPRRFQLPDALAAALAMVALGLGAWNLDLRQRGAATRESLAAAEERLAKSEAERARLAAAAPAPSVNVPILDLEPAIPTRGGAAPRPHVLEFASGVEAATLILVTRPMPPHPRYVLEVRDGAGRTLWRTEGLKRSAYDTLTLSVPRTLLPAGSYRFILYGVRPDDELAHLEEYALTVRLP